jgi:hypothetical protein
MMDMNNKLHNKQDRLFSSNMSYLHKELGSQNEFKKTYKSSDFIKSCLFYGNNFKFYPIT